MATGLGGLMAGTMIFMGLAWIAGIIGLIFWIFMLIDAVKRKYKKDDDKIIWILVVVLAGIIGAIIYYFAVKRENKK